MNRSIDFTQQSKTIRLESAIRNAGEKRIRDRFRMAAVDIPVVERRGVRRCSICDVSEQSLEAVRRVYICEVRAMRSKLAKERITVPFDALANYGDADRKSTRLNS